MYVFCIFIVRVCVHWPSTGILLCSTAVGPFRVDQICVIVLFYWIADLI